MLHHFIWNPCMVYLSCICSCVPGCFKGKHIRCNSCPRSTVFHSSCNRPYQQKRILDFFTPNQFSSFKLKSLKNIPWFYNQGPFFSGEISLGFHPRSFHVQVSFGRLRWHDPTAARLGRCGRREADRSGDLGPESPAKDGRSGAAWGWDHPGEYIQVTSSSKRYSRQ